MNVWRVGSKWGATPVFDLMFESRVVFWGSDWYTNPSRVQKGDLVALAEPGTKRILAIGKIGSAVANMSEVRAGNRRSSDLAEYDEAWAVRLSSLFLLEKKDIFSTCDYKRFYNLSGDPEAYKQTIAMFNKYKGDGKVNALYELLKRTNQIVLTGAPGTGKTYLARQIAQQMILGKVVTKEEDLTPDEIAKLKDQMEFVQFHPSYDYTDFIEGLRPYTVDDDATPGFRREDGVFKRLCKRALRDDVDGGEDNFEEAWDRLVEMIDDAEDERIEIPCLKKAKTFPIEMNSYRDGLASRTYDESQKSGYVQGRSKFMNKEQLYRIYRGLPGTPKKGHDNYRKAIVEFMKKECGLKPYKKGKEKSAQDRRKYVMIIDEINRGDIAKIFGELFFAMDKGYRGKKAMSLKTQYQNLVDDDDFGEGFYVPDNVYIIGTMNDIDRNVESMDFAIRRRFTWKEISPDMRFDAMWSDLDGVSETVKKEARRRMNAINKAISNTNGLGPAYQIGPSYFRELDTYKEEADGGFGSLWSNHLEPLIREYLRGFPNAEKLVEKIRTEYNKPEVTGEEVATE